MRHTPLKYTPIRHAYEIHTLEMHARKVLGEIFRSPTLQTVVRRSICQDLSCKIRVFANSNLDKSTTHMRTPMIYLFLTGVHLTGVHLMGVYLTGVHLMGVYLTGVHLMGVYLTGVHLTGVYLMGVHLIDVYFMDVYMFPNPKRPWRNLQIPHLTNGGRFVEI
jgi:hypothetical protein